MAPLTEKQELLTRISTTSKNLAEFDLDSLFTKVGQIWTGKDKEIIRLTQTLYDAFKQAKPFFETSLEMWNHSRLVKLHNALEHIHSSLKSVSTFEANEQFTLSQLDSQRTSFEEQLYDALDNVQSNLEPLHQQNLIEALSP
jgi:hypothetical protein